MAYSLCKISPDEFWDYSPAEINLMIDVAYKDIESKNKLEAIRHADLKVSILNAPYSRRKDEKLYKIEDFLDKETLGDLRPKKRKPISKKDQAAMWSAAGNAYIKQFEKK